MRRLIGYCPQHDALLDLLTVREHLELYARIKGVSATAVGEVAYTKMEQLDLLDFADKQSRMLSGGNKRKLSVAISMIGSPNIFAAVAMLKPEIGESRIAYLYIALVPSKAGSMKLYLSLLYDYGGIMMTQQLLSTKWHNNHRSQWNTE